jgi:diaminohydroxyphosphoribosylaminopyrimidine deaminase/5-amino-6-(5-phosphoribosylamino)uracil reductase
VTTNPQNEKYIERCFQLAKLGGKMVRPNPMVGAVLVYKDRIIGEGWHERFGGAHAEVNCIESVSAQDEDKISKSTLYVSLEPCSFHGKTPACSQLILKQKIPKVVISSRDPNPKVDGAGIRMLQNSGVEVITDVLDNKGSDLIRPFKVNHNWQRPYIILKIVKSKYNFLGIPGEKIWLSNQHSTILSHRWRSNVDGIMVGTETVLSDDPKLDNRLFHGESPTRIFPDRQNRISEKYHILDGSTPTTIIPDNERPLNIKNTTTLIHDFNSEFSLAEMVKKLFDMGIFILLVEGGQKLIKSFLKDDLWDEARVIHTAHELNTGLMAPNITGRLLESIHLESDTCQRILNERLHGDNEF